MKSQFFQKVDRSELMPNFCVIVFPAWFLDLPMTLPEVTSCASWITTISLSVRAVRQFAKEFKFKVPFGLAQGYPIV